MVRGDAGLGQAWDVLSIRRGIGAFSPWYLLLRVLGSFLFLPIIIPLRCMENERIYILYKPRRDSSSLPNQKIPAFCFQRKAKNKISEHQGRQSIQRCLLMRVPSSTYMRPACSALTDRVLKISSRPSLFARGKQLESKQQRGFISHSHSSQQSKRGQKCRHITKCKEENVLVFAEV